jgi:inorganic pyrophosphatase
MPSIDTSRHRNGRRQGAVCRREIAALLLCVPALLAAQPSTRPPNVLPETAVAKLASSLDAARAHGRHVWRDTPPFDGENLVNAYIEIPRGERRKYEFAMKENERAIDRIIPEDVGGYPVNYGFVPQTISYDGDPFDALVLGPALAGGRLVRGRIVGLMLMEDEKGIDSKVVLSLVDASGRATHTLTAEDQKRIGDYFDAYKRHVPGGFSNVPGWGSADDGRAHVTMTNAFFRDCRERAGQPCRIEGR